MYLVRMKGRDSRFIRHRPSMIDGDNGLLILSERHIVGTIIKFIFSNVPVAMEMVVDPVIQIFVEVNQKTF